MKILAVIPARAGSKGIPNKNIRIVGGHPLIYYSIKNALSSSYITDVVITTDSEHVRLLENKWEQGLNGEMLLFVGMQLLLTLLLQMHSSK